MPEKSFVLNTKSYIQSKTGVLFRVQHGVNILPCLWEEKKKEAEWLNFPVQSFLINLLQHDNTQPGTYTHIHTSQVSAMWCEMKGIYTRANWYSTRPMCLKCTLHLPVMCVCACLIFIHADAQVQHTQYVIKHLQYTRPYCLHCSIIYAWKVGWFMNVVHKSPPKTISLSKCLKAALDLRKIPELFWHLEEHRGPGQTGKPASANAHVSF